MSITALATNVGAHSKRTDFGIRIINTSDADRAFPKFVVAVNDFAQRFFIAIIAVHDENIKSIAVASDDDAETFGIFKN